MKVTGSGKMEALGVMSYLGYVAVVDVAQLVKGWDGKC